MKIRKVKIMQTLSDNKVNAQCHCFLSWSCTIYVCADGNLAILYTFYCDVTSLCAFLIVYYY